MKLFKRYMDDIICTVRGDPDKYIEMGNCLLNNLQFSLEKVNMEGKLAFVDIDVNVSSKINITCHWLQHKKKLIQRTVHRVFKATSN